MENKNKMINDLVNAWNTLKEYDENGCWKRKGSEKIFRSSSFWSITLQRGHQPAEQVDIIINYGNKSAIAVLPFIRENYNDDEIIKYFAHLINFLEKDNEIKDNISRMNAFDLDINYLFYSKKDNICK